MRAYGVVVGSQKKERVGSPKRENGSQKKGAVSSVIKPLDGIGCTGFYVRERANELRFYATGNKNLLNIRLWVIAQMRQATQASAPFAPANKAEKLNRSCCASVGISPLKSNFRAIGILEIYVLC